MTDLAKMNIDELKAYRVKVQSEFYENQRRYDERYSNQNSFYADSINDEYNGEAEELSELSSKLREIDRIIQSKS